MQHKPIPKKLSSRDNDTENQSSTTQLTKLNRCAKQLAIETFVFRTPLISLSHLIFDLELYQGGMSLSTYIMS